MHNIRRKILIYTSNMDGGTKSRQIRKENVNFLLIGLKKPQKHSVKV